MSSRRTSKSPISSRYRHLSERLRVTNAEKRELAFEAAICSIPPGKVATYGQVAAAAGVPRGHRLVASFLRLTMSDVPWQRVVGAGGEIKTSGSGAARQRSLLKAEGILISGKRIDMVRFGHHFDLE